MLVFIIICVVTLALSLILHKICSNERIKSIMTTISIISFFLLCASPYINTVASCSMMTKDDKDELYEKAWSEGYDEGYNFGYDDGWEDGWEDYMLEEGMEEYDKGYDEGYSIGYDDGYIEGYDEGWEESLNIYINE